MPNRIIKESICSSEEIDALTPEQEVLFYRLMVAVDDYGRHDARLKIIASKCYPLKSIDIRSIQVNLDRLQEVGLIQLYEVEGRPYVCLSNWAKHQQIRAKRAKYPGPEESSDITCNQMQADVHARAESESESESKESTSPDGLVVASLTAADPCPHVEIVAAYHELLPMCTAVRTWPEHRRAFLRQRWRESEKRQSIGWWRKFFAYVAESRFLTGRGEASPGRDPFVADLEWLVRPQNFAKVIEGKYHREEAAA